MGSIRRSLLRDRLSDLTNDLSQALHGIIDVVFGCVTPD